MRMAALLPEKTENGIGETPNPQSKTARTSPRGSISDAAD
jgi:hypothetical protein